MISLPLQSRLKVNGQSLRKSSQWGGVLKSVMHAQSCGFAH